MRPWWVDVTGVGQNREHGPHRTGPDRTNMIRDGIRRRWRRRAWSMTINKYASNACTGWGVVLCVWPDGGAGTRTTRRRAYIYIYIYIYTYIYESIRLVPPVSAAAPQWQKRIAAINCRRHHTMAEKTLVSDEHEFLRHECRQVGV